MSWLTERPSDYIEVRHCLQQVATQILARARFLATGRFGLRVTGTGIGSPAFGADGEVLRIAADLLIRERRVDGRMVTSVIDLDGRSLGELAEFASVPLDTDFSAGPDAPAPLDPTAPLLASRPSVDALHAWFRLGAATLDEVLRRVEEPSVLQLWPEHFDLGVDVATHSGRVNLGASPGDAGHPDPYLYLGPWDEGRPGDPAYWNAAFGAVLSATDLESVDDPLAHAVAFIKRGLELLD